MNINILALKKKEISIYCTAFHTAYKLCTIKISLHSFNVFHYVLVQFIFNLVLQYILIRLITLAHVWQSEVITTAIG